MRKYSTILFLTVLSVCLNAMAIGPVNDQQIMLYYNIPLGGNSPQDREHKFGLRFDQTTSEPGEITDFDILMKKPAMFDLQSSHEGAYTFKIHGTDYTDKLAVYRADEAEKPKAETAADKETGANTEAATKAKPGAETETTTKAEAGAETKGEAETGEAPAEEDKRTIVQKTLDELPFGVVIGVGLLIGLLAGVGG